MKVEEIAGLVNGRVDGDGSRIIKAVAGIESAESDDITFAEGERALNRASGSNAGCILVPAGASIAEKTTIAVSHPKIALIRAAEALLPPRRSESGIHPTAILAPDAVLSSDVSVGPHVVIEEGVKIGPRTSLRARVYLGRGVEIGADSVLYSGAVVYPGARIGSRVAIHAGAVIGADGFGYVFAEGRHQKFPQIGQLLIEDDVEIGANTTIDCGSLGNTIIGQGTKIDNLVQIAHNVRIGRHCVIAAQTGISGSVEIGNYVVIGGQVGIGDKVRIEDQVVIGAQAGIPTGKILRRGSAVWGTPARPMTEFKKSWAQVAKLPRLAREVKKLAEWVAARSTRE
jgi:UDP-3-O-[3-hydroxymyristoyl] glucosamine N-acyltransferase